MVDPTFQKNLMTALESAVKHYNGGSSPTEAVKKAASDARFNLDQTKRLTETFNTARTIYHFDQHKDAYKSASFELADADRVILDLFDAKTPEPQKKEASYKGYSFYDNEPQDHTLRDIDISLVPKGDGGLSDLSVNSQVRKLYKFAHVYEELAEDLNSKLDMINVKLGELFTKLAQDVKYAAIANGNDIVDRLYLAHARPRFEPVLKKLSEFLPKAYQPNKDNFKKYGKVIENRDLVKFASVIERIAGLMEQSANSTAMVAGLVKDAEYVRSEVSGMFTKEAQRRPRRRQSTHPTRGSGQLTQTPQTPQPPSTGNPPAGGSNSGSGKGSGWGFDGAIFGDDLIDMSPSKSLSELHSAMSGIVDTARTSDDIIGVIMDDTPREDKPVVQKINKLRHEHILYKLVTRDPVLADANPIDVARAYQSVIQLAPNVSYNEAVVRSILRTMHAHDSLSSFDAKSMADLEKIIQQTAGTYKGKGGD